MRPTNADGDRKCCWTETEEDFDCRLIWPTTAEPSPGCCAGDSKRSTARCADEDDYFVCTRMSSCHWIEYDDASDDESLCAWPTTTPTPQEPGCCYVSSYMGLGGPWEDRCKLAWTERECLMARDQDDVNRCQWMDAPSDFDCRQVWPTPPVEEGCCAGKNEDSADWCNEVDTMARCDRKSNCYWIETDDFTECEYESYNTTALIEDGCCYIADTQNPMSGWRERCTEFYSSDSCERPLDQSDNNRCVWEDTSPDFDCREIWPSTTTEAPGCCGAENARSYDTCRAIDESHRCERMSSCFWLVTDDESECEMSTTGPADPGCCYINDASYLGTRWETVCEEMNREGDCVGVQHGGSGDFVCEWTSMPSETDCIVLWPTPEPEIGCCTGNSFASMDRCVAETDQGKCDRMSICHWLHTEDHSECLETETTESPPPGCCMLADTRPSAYSNGWDDTCKAYHTEEACVRPYSQDGHARCVWQDTEEDFDCMNLWPTVGPTTPPAPGCCNGETLRASERCILSVEEDHCNRMSSCSWIVTDDPTECEYVEPTVPPPEPGCCNEATGAYSAGTHSRWTEICRSFNTEMDCMTPLDQNSGDYRCEWTPTVEDFDCAITWPTTLPPQEGCCKGDAPRTNVRCNGYENEDKCLRMSSCQWVVTEDMTDIEAEQACEFIETTDVPPAPGCCMLDDVRPMSYEMGWDGQCITYATEQRCITPQSQDGTQRCRWEETGDDVDCSQLWPTTAEPTPGCCTGNSEAATLRCQPEDTEVRCDRRASCHWIETDDPTVCDWNVETPPPYGSGCCVVPDGADVTDGLTTRCNTQFTERQCLLQLDVDGEYECEWTDTSDEFDCETLWPTPPPDTGCCMGETEYSHDRCAMSGERDRCNRISGCHWLSTDDPADCIFVPPTTTPPPPGCCYLHSSQNPMSGWAERCSDYFTEMTCTGPMDGGGNSRCNWSDAPEGTDCETFWPSTTPSVGCCAGDTEGATDRCGAVDSKWDCNSRR